MGFCRGLSIPLIAYVCLDIANPLMPGALHFAAGTIQAVEADRARSGDDAPAPVALPLPARASVITRCNPGALRRRTVRAGLRRGPPRSPRPHPRPTAPSADDH